MFVRSARVIRHLHYTPEQFFGLLFKVSLGVMCSGMLHLQVDRSCTFRHSISWDTKSPAISKPGFVSIFMRRRFAVKLFCPNVVFVLIACSLSGPVISSLVGV